MISNLSSNDISDEKITVEIPPWALPKEEITFYVKLCKGLDFSKIHIVLPDCLEFKDTINVTKLEESNNDIKILDIGRSKLSKYDYFGITVASRELFDELAVQSKVSITLFEADGNQISTQTSARIFRPKLEFQQIPEQILLKNVKDTTLPIHLKFKGFGDISLRIECNVGGDLVSEGGTSLIENIFQGMLREGFLEAEPENIEKRDFQINKATLTRDLDEFKFKLKDPEYLKSLEKDKKISSETIEWLKSFDQSKQEKFMNVLYDNMEGYLIKKLVDMFSRNLSRHLQIDSGTNISTKIQAKLTKLNLKIFYRDLNGNAYAPLETSLDIVDKRKSDSEIHVTIPIKIEKVDETEAYKNVGEMIIPNVS